MMISHLFSILVLFTLLSSEGFAQITNSQSYGDQISKSTSTFENWAENLSQTLGRNISFEFGYEEASYIKSEEARDLIHILLTKPNVSKLLAHNVRIVIEQNGARILPDSKFISYIAFGPAENKAQLQHHIEVVENQLTAFLKFPKNNVVGRNNKKIKLVSIYRTDGKLSNIEKAWSLAQSYIIAAAQKFRTRAFVGDYELDYNYMASVASQVRLSYPGHEVGTIQSMSTCNYNDWAQGWISFDKSYAPFEIQVCPLGAKLKEEFLAEVLVHELAHTGPRGTSDECEADSVAMMAHFLATGRDPVYSRYIDRCLKESKSWGLFQSNDGNTYKISLDDEFDENVIVRPYDGPYEVVKKRTGHREFLSSGSFVVPEDVDTISIFVSSGSGGSGASCGAYSGGSGGSGTSDRRTFKVSPGDMLIVTVGQGEAGQCFNGQGGDGGGARIKGKNIKIGVRGGRGGGGATCGGGYSGGCGGDGGKGYARISW